MGVKILQVLQESSCHLPPPFINAAQNPPRTFSHLKIKALKNVSLTRVYRELFIKISQKTCKSDRTFRSKVSNLQSSIFNSDKIWILCTFSDHYWHTINMLTIAVQIIAKKAIKSSMQLDSYKNYNVIQKILTLIWNCWLKWLTSLDVGDKPCLQSRRWRC